MEPLDKDFLQHSQEFQQGYDAGWRDCAKMILKIIYALIALFGSLYIFQLIRPFLQPTH